MATLQFGDTGSCPAMYKTQEFIGIPRGVSPQGVVSYPTENFTWSLPETATTINNELLYKVFYNCDTLTGVDLSSITSIGNPQSDDDYHSNNEYRGGLAYAFYNCSNLTNVDLSSLTSIVSSAFPDYTYGYGDGLAYAFYNCSNLTNVDLSSLTSVSRCGLSYAFQGCTSLTSINLSSLTTIDNSGLSGTFNGCTGLKSVDLSALTSIGSSGLSNAFSGCSGLTSVNLSALTTISSTGGLSYAFQGCTASFSVDLSSLTTVGYNGLYYAFQGCSRLASVDLSALTTVSDNRGLYYAFQGCTGLTSIDLPSLTTVSGTYGLAVAFSGCTGLTSVDLSSLTTVSGTYGLNSAFSGCSKLTSIDLSSLTSVSDHGLCSAFQNCTSLTSVDLSSLTTVSGGNGLNSTFSGCSKLTSVDLSSLTSVGGSGLNSAFSGCTGLTSIDLPSLTTISGDNTFIYAFRGCTGLTDIYFRALTITSFGSYYKNQFTNMMQNTGTSKIHTLHFPANMESTISGLTGYPLFGGTSGYVVCAFDLPATSGIINFNNKTSETIYINKTIYNSNSYYHNGEETSCTIIDTNNVIYTNVITPPTVMSNYTIDVGSLFTNPNTINLATSISGLTVTFDVNGTIIPAIADGNGNYSILTAGSGFNVNYYINGGSSYIDEQGTITTTGSNITQNITMTPAIESQFVRPDLIEDGTLGGNSFAVYADSEALMDPAFYAVDDDPDTTCMVNFIDINYPETWLKYTFYNPIAIKVTSIGLKLYNVFDTPDLTFEASNDNTNWTTLSVTSTSTSGDYLVSTIDNTSLYKYYKITLKPANEWDHYFESGISDITITAIQKVPTV